MVRVSKGDFDPMQLQTFSEEERSAYVKIINSSLSDDPICKKYFRYVYYKNINVSTTNHFTLVRGHLHCTA